MTEENYTYCDVCKQHIKYHREPVPGGPPSRMRIVCDAGHTLSTYRSTTGQSAPVSERRDF